jgi:hypothetical protein
MKPVKNIWCCRRQEVFFLISKVKDHGETAWYIVFFGKEFWIGPEKPGFLDRKKRTQLKS